MTGSCLWRPRRQDVPATAVMRFGRGTRPGARPDLACRSLPSRSPLPHPPSKNAQPSPTHRADSRQVQAYRCGSYARSRNAPVCTSAGRPSPRRACRRRGRRGRWCVQSRLWQVGRCRGLLRNRRIAVERARVCSWCSVVRRRPRDGRRAFPHEERRACVVGRRWRSDRVRASRRAAYSDRGRPERHLPMMPTFTLEVAAG
jgi:hypothetical protein